MKQSFKNVLIFVGGIATGAVSMYFGVKKYFEMVADKEVESVRAAYDKMARELDPEVTSLEDPDHFKEVKETEVVDSADETAKGSNKARELNNKPPITDYTKFYKSKGSDGNVALNEFVKRANEDKLAELESPPDDEPLSDEEDDEQQEDFDDELLNGAHKRGEDATIITKDEFELGNRGYDRISLLYYKSDDIITNEDNELISWDDIIGSEVECAIDKSAFDDNDDEVLYVRSHRLITDFEVTKVWTAFEG